MGGGGGEGQGGGGNAVTVVMCVVLEDVCVVLEDEMGGEGREGCIGGVAAGGEKG